MNENEENPGQGTPNRPSAAKLINGQSEFCDAERVERLEKLLKEIKEEIAKNLAMYEDNKPKPPRTEPSKQK